MLFVFMDESGSVYSSYAAYSEGYEGRLQRAREAGTDFPPYPFFVLAAVGIPESHLSVVDDWFRDVKKSYLGLSTDPCKSHELKASILYALRCGTPPVEWSAKSQRTKPLVLAQKKVWGALSASQLQNLERSIFQLMQRLSPTVWIVVVKQPELYRKHKERTWHPFYWALTFLQQRVVQHVQVTHGGYERALFVMDENSNLRSASQFDSFLVTRGRINSTASWPANFYRYVIDIPVNGSSHLHESIQLADFVAHAASRHVRKQDTLCWFPRIEPFLARHYSAGTPRNAGITFIPG